MSRSPNTTTAPTGGIAPFGLRMLPELKEKLEEVAKAAGRSMNAEIVNRLETSFRSSSPSTGGLLSPQHLLQVVDAQRKTIQAQEVTAMMLSTYLIDVLNALPKKLQGEDRIKAAAQFVLGMGEGADRVAHQSLLQLDTPPAVETIKAVVRGKTVDTGIPDRFASKKR